MGIKGSEPHSHYGFDRNMSIRFSEHRGRIVSIRREVVDSNLGKVEDRTLELKPGPGKQSFQLKFYADEPSRTVRVAFEESGFVPVVPSQ